MDRLRALEILDSLPPDHRAAALRESALDEESSVAAEGQGGASPDSRELLVRDALRTLGIDAEGRRHLEFRRELELRGPFDVELGRAMRDVPVPRDARRRLEERLAAAADRVESDAAEKDVGDENAAACDAPLCAPARANVRPLSNAQSPVPTPTSAGPRRSTRRLWLGSALAAAVVAVFGFWLLRPTPKVAFQTVLRTEIADAQSLPVLPDGTFRLPAGWEGAVAYNLTAAGEPVFRRKSIVGPEGRGEAGVFFFSVPTRGIPVEGYLLVLPAARVADPPEATSFATAAPEYNGSLVTVAWTEGDQVFLCVVRNGEPGLRLLGRALGNSMA